MAKVSKPDEVKNGASDAQYHHGDLRNALLSAAADLVEEAGAARLSLREVARRCGVSQTAPYRHFKTRDALLSAVSAAAFRDFTRALAAEADQAPDPAARLKALGRAYVRFGLDRPESLRLMFGPGSLKGNMSLDLTEAATAAYALITDATVARLAEPWTIGIDPQAATFGAWALVHGLANLMIDRPMPAELSDPTFRDDLVDQLVGIFERGLSVD